MVSKSATLSASVAGLPPGALRPSAKTEHTTFPPLVKAIRPDGFSPNTCVALPVATSL